MRIKSTTANTKTVRRLTLSVVTIILLLFLCISSAAAEDTQGTVVSLTACDISVNADSVIRDLGYTINGEQVQSVVVVKGGSAVIEVPDFPPTAKLHVETSGTALFQLGQKTVTVSNVESEHVIVKLSGGKRVAVTFNANGGEGVMSAQDFSEGIPDTLRLNAFNPATGWKCKKFAGWAETAGGSVKYTDGQKITVTKDITLYAVWNTVHTVETVARKEATRTEDGYTAWSRCNVCGEVLTPAVVIKALGHNAADSARENEVIQITNPTVAPTSSPLTNPEQHPDTIYVNGEDTSDGKSPYAVSDITAEYYDVPYLNSVLSTVTVLDLLSTANTDIFVKELKSEHPEMSVAELQRITEIFSRAANAGVITKTANNAPVLLSGTAVTEGNVKFYCVYDIKAEAGSDAVNRIDFAVPLADIASAEMTERDIIMYHGFPDYNVWVPLDTYLAGIDETHAYYSAYTQSASPFAVVFMKDMTIVPGESSGQKYLWLIILIIAAVLIAGIITGVCIRQHRKKTTGFSEIK